MTKRPRHLGSLRFVLLSVAAALCLAIVTIAGQAHAGTLRVHDDAHALSSSELADLRSTVSSLPFDADVAVTTDYPEAPDLARYAHSLAGERDEIAIALDPQHRHVKLWFTAGTFIPPGARPAIDRAGNDAFSHGKWAEGLSQILTTAGASVEQRHTAAPLPAPEVHHSFFGTGLVLLVIAGVIGFAIFAARRRFTGGPYDGGYGGGYGPPGPYQGGGYPVGPGQGGMGPLGGGIVGAGLGGLAGYEIGKMQGEREERDREGSWNRGEEPRRGGDDADTGYDAGGGGSSWDGGGDSGGGFDGGGGDSGGGGGDF